MKLSAMCGRPCPLVTSLVDLFSGSNSLVSINTAGSGGNQKPPGKQGECAVPLGHLATTEHTAVPC